LLNTSAKPLAAGYKRSMPHSEFSTYRRTERILSLQIGDHYHE